MDPMQFGLALRRSNAILEPPEYTQVKRFPGIDRISPLERHWNNKLRIGIGKAHTGGHDADDAPRYPINADSLPNHIPILSKSLLPVSVAKDDDKVPSGLLLVPGEEATHKRMNLQGVKCIGHDRGAKHSVR